MALLADLLGTNPITDLTATVKDSLTSLTGDILGTNQTLAGAQDSVTGGAATGDSLLQTLDGLTGTLQDLAGGLPVVGPQLTDAVSTLTTTVGGLTAGVPLDAATLGQITSQLNTITDRGEHQQRRVAPRVAGAARYHHVTAEPSDGRHWRWRR